MRKVQCDRKSGSCWLQPSHHTKQVGRGGLVPIATQYLIQLPHMSNKKAENITHRKQTGSGRLIPISTEYIEPVPRVLSKKKLAGGGHKRSKCTKSSLSLKLVSDKSRSKRKPAKKREKKNGDVEI